MGINHRFIHRLVLGFVILNGLFAGAFAQLTFTTNTYNVERGPRCVVAADMNGDAKLDLVCGSVLYGVLTVLTNDGTGNFGSNATVSVKEGQWDLITLDIEPDGDSDLIAATANNGWLIIVTNNGAGSLGSNAALHVGTGQFFVAAADFNGDAKEDLIGADPYMNYLTALTNNGNGGFAFNALYNTGNRPVKVIAPDVNGDGVPDLVSANNLDNTLMVLTNKGNGAFGLSAVVPVTVSSAQGLYSVVAGDVNGDDEVDLIGVSYGGHSINGRLTVLTNNGIGRFSVKASMRVGVEAYSATVADLNADGKLDLVSASHGDNTLILFTNDGSGGFSSNATLNVSHQPYSIIVADVNSDSRLDLITANDEADTLTVLINTTTYPPPSLSIMPGDNQVALYWPAWGGSYALESVTDLASTDWLIVTNGLLLTDRPAVMGVTLTNMPSGQFFRLRAF